MRIGILTFHSQLNYGGVLQAFALQKVLQSLGHDVVVIDRWLEPDNHSLEQGYDRLGIAGWINVAGRSLLGGWEWRKYRRVQATKRFIHEYMHLTPYHFVNWSDAPKDLGIDLIVVGSDQVWHSGDYSNPSVYLLEGAPKIPAVAYAASFGMKEIPNSCEKQYRDGLSRFSSISCRESEGVSLCRSLGFNATHVVDPTLLIKSDVWLQMINPWPKHRHSKPKLFCYLMDGNVPAHIRSLELFANQNDVDIDVFLDGRFFVPLPKSIKELYERYHSWRIHRRIDAGPLEFVQSIIDADFVLTDSFHALMFSCIFNKNVRFLSPENSNRQRMFARVKEFAVKCVFGPIIMDGIDDALYSWQHGNKVSFHLDVIAEKRIESVEWLKGALSSI